MMMKTTLAALAAALLALAPLPLAAQEAATLLVQATAAESGAPLAGARVSVDGAARGVTDADGSARIDGVAAGTRRIEVSLVGRKARAFRLPLSAGAVEDVAVALEADPVALPSVTGAARAAPRSPQLRDFYQRARTGSNGRFVTREQIEERRPRAITDVFREIPGVRVIYGPAGAEVRIDRAIAKLNERTMAGDSTADCYPVYYVDGVRFPFREGSIDAVFQIAQVEGVEVYTGVVPARFNSSEAGCGVIVVWTRERGDPALAAPAGGTPSPASPAAPAPPEGRDR